MIKAALPAAAIALCIGLCPVAAYADENMRIIELESGAEKGAGFTSVNEIFDTGAGSYRGLAGLQGH